MNQRRHSWLGFLVFFGIVTFVLTQATIGAAQTRPLPLAVEACSGLLELGGVIGVNWPEAEWETYYRGLGFKKIADAMMFRIEAVDGIALAGAKVSQEVRQAWCGFYPKRPNPMPAAILQWMLNHNKGVRLVDVNVLEITLESEAVTAAGLHGTATKSVRVGITDGSLYRVYVQVGWAVR